MATEAPSRTSLYAGQVKGMSIHKKCILGRIYPPFAASVQASPFPGYRNHTPSVPSRPIPLQRIYAEVTPRPKQYTK